MLKAGFPTHRDGYLGIRIEVGEALSQKGLRPGGRAYGFRDTVRKGVRQSGQEIQAIVVGEHQVGVLREAILENVSTALAEEAREHTETGAQDRPAVELVGQAGARHEDVLR